MRPDIAPRWQLLRAATQFLTCLPVGHVEWRPDWLARSAKFFPLVGAGIGGIAAITLVGASRLWPAPIPAMLAVAVAILITGALHEDGLADSTDSLGGRTREARLAIMKDSRIGTFGALALALTFALRVAALSVMPVAGAAAALLAAHAASRFACVVAMARLPYAGERSLAKVEYGTARPDGAEIALAALLGLTPFLLLEPGHAVAALGLGAGLAASAVWQANRLLGGHTGDVLGAVVVLSETGILVGAAAAMPS